jgi:hypothetical protein
MKYILCTLCLSMMMVPLAFAKNDRLEMQKALFELEVKNFNQQRRIGEILKDSSLDYADRLWMNANFDKSLILPEITLKEPFELTLNSGKIVLKVEPTSSRFSLNGYPLDFEGRRTYKERAAYISRVLTHQHVSLWNFIIPQAVAAEILDISQSLNFSMALTRYIGKYSHQMWGQNKSDSVLISAMLGKNPENVLHIDYTCGAGTPEDGNCAEDSLVITRYFTAGTPSYEEHTAKIISSNQSACGTTKPQLETNLNVKYDADASYHAEDETILAMKNDDQRINAALIKCCGNIRDADAIKRNAALEKNAGNNCFSRAQKAAESFATGKGGGIRTDSIRVRGTK